MQVIKNLEEKQMKKAKEIISTFMGVGAFTLIIMAMFLYAIEDLTMEGYKFLVNCLLVALFFGVFSWALAE